MRLTSKQQSAVNNAFPGHIILHGQDNQCGTTIYTLGVDLWRSRKLPSYDEKIVVAGMGCFESIDEAIVAIQDRIQHTKTPPKRQNPRLESS